MLHRPERLSESVAPIVVEVESSPGSGRFRVDDRLRAESVEVGSDGRMGQAIVSVRLDDDFDFLEARQRYSSDCRLVIRSDAAEVDDQVVLFEGYPLRQESVRDGRPGRAIDSYRLEAEPVACRWGSDRCCWIFGRRMRSGEIADGMMVDPGGFSSRFVHVEALPCVFNAGGVGNRAKVPLIVVDRAGCERRIPIFSYDGDASAERWSLADALRYLVWFHHVVEGPVSVDEFLDLTEATVGVDPDDRGGFVASSGVVEALLGVADDLDCEGESLADALVKAAEAAGVHVSCLTAGDDGRASSRLAVWAAGDGEVKSLPLAWGGRYGDGSRRYDTSVASGRDLFADNRLRRVELVWDDSEIVNGPVVVGDVRRYELTVPLVPGWLPTENLDNVAAADRDYARNLALTPDMVEYLGDDAEYSEWFRKYHSWGSEYDEHRDVGRLWVLNEDGAFGTDEYGRHVPFDVYTPFDFSTVMDADVVGAKDWVRRPRPMAAMEAEDGSRVKVQVELSYDSGATWYATEGKATVLKDRAGVRFSLPNPTALFPTDGTYYDQNMWYALVDQTFRVRARASFEGDGRLVVEHRPDSSRTPTLWNCSRLRYRPGDYRFVHRAGELSGVDDTSAARRAARIVAANEGGGRVEATVVIPWLDCDFAIGDRISGLCGRDVSLSGRLRAQALDGPAWCVVGKRYELGEKGPETTLELSRIVEVG